MKVELQRFKHDAESTLGHLSIDGDYFCLILEDQPQPNGKVARETRIPAGTYELELKPIGTSKFDATAGKIIGPAYRGMIRLREVPNFSEVLVHWGSFETDTDACLLTGTVEFLDTRGHFAVSGSRDAFKKVYLALVGAFGCEEVNIDVRDEP